jgi:DNA invertase Pin-like site-specific DNA recombinase
MKMGYCRVSTEDQSLDVQREALQAAGCERIFEEKVSGKSADNRDQLQALLSFVREGDVLTVCKLDRLARSLPDLFKIIETLETKGAQLVVLNNSAIDTTTPMGRCVFAIFGAIAELERNLIRERQTEGIEAAKRNGVYKGAIRRFDPATIRQMRDAGKRVCDIASELGCSDDTVQRALKGAL